MLLRHVAHSMFRVDVRSLAAMRIVLGALLAYDVTARAWHLTPHYTDAGVWPVPYAADLVFPYSFSVHFASGGWLCSAALFVVHALAAVALALGFHSRASAVVCWLLTTSLHNRNPMVLAGGDHLLRLLLLLAVFLPVGRCYSIDDFTASWRQCHGELAPFVRSLQRQHRGRHRRAFVDRQALLPHSGSGARAVDDAAAAGAAHDNSDDERDDERDDEHVDDGKRESSGSVVFEHVSMASAALALQVGVMYLVAAFHKGSSLEWRTGTAFYYALSNRMYATRTGSFVLALAPAWLLSLATSAMLWTKLLLPLLVCPLAYHSAARTAAFILACSMHLVYGACIDVGCVSIVAPIAAAMALAPSVIWEALARWWALLATPRYYRLVGRRALCVVSPVRGGGRDAWTELDQLLFALLLYSIPSCCVGTIRHVAREQDTAESSVASSTLGFGSASSFRARGDSIIFECSSVSVGSAASAASSSGAPTAAPGALLGLMALSPMSCMLPLVGASTLRIVRSALYGSLVSSPALGSLLPREAVKMADNTTSGRNTSAAVSVASCARVSRTLVRLLFGAAVVYALYYQLEASVPMLPAMSPRVATLAQTLQLTQFWSTYCRSTGSSSSRSELTHTLKRLKLVVVVLQA